MSFFDKLKSGLAKTKASLFGVLKKAEGTEKSLTACPVMWYNTVTVV